MARNPKPPALGVSVSTAVPMVGVHVPYVKPGVGAIATQALTHIKYGVYGLELLKKGFSPETAINIMLKDDLERETRQVIVINKQGRTAAFTGNETKDWKGHIIGRDYVVAGNMLVGCRVIDEMAQRFTASKGNLAEKLMSALEAGQEAGGDKRGRMSAALLVAIEEQTDGWSSLTLRVDQHHDPVNELRKRLTSSLQPML